MVAYHIFSAQAAITAYFIRSRFCIHWPLLILWLLNLGAIIGCSWLFYSVIEAPSHRLAKLVGKYLKNKTATSVTGAPVAGELPS